MTEQGTTAPRYWSASKGAWVDIATMPTPHLSNAAKKLVARMASSPDGDLQETDGDQNVAAACIDELARRVPPKKHLDVVREVRDVFIEDGYAPFNELIEKLSMVLGEEWNAAESRWERPNDGGGPPLDAA